MAGTSELIDFRRAFVWLLCGMLLPSVALVAFGVVAVVNERVAVERRLETQYSARLRVLDTDLRARLEAAAADATAQAMALRGDASAPKAREPFDDPANAHPHGNGTLTAVQPPSDRTAQTTLSDDSHTGPGVDADAAGLAAPQPDDVAGEPAASAD